MASRAASKPVDVQKLVSGAAKFELKLLSAAVEAMQVYISQAARLSDLAGETLRAIQDDRATLADTARKLTEFGRHNVRAYAELSQRLSASYYNELDRLAGSALKPNAASAAAKVATAAKPAKAARQVARKAARA